MASKKARQPLEAGVRAPGFRLGKLDGGGSATLDELLAGGPTMLAFFKVSCPTCQYALPYLERMSKSDRLRFVAVSQDDADATREFHAELGISMPTLLDDEDAGYPASNAYGLANVPSLFLVEPDGKISQTSVGFSKRDLEAIGARAGVAPFRPGEKVPEWKSG